MKTILNKFFLVCIGLLTMLSGCKKKSDSVEPVNTQPMSYSYSGSISYGANNRLSINKLNESPMDKTIPFDGAYYAVSYDRYSEGSYKKNNFLRIGQINLNNSTITSTILGDTSKVDILIMALESEIVPGTYPIYSPSNSFTPLKNLYRNSLNTNIYDFLNQPVGTTSASTLYTRNVLIRTENATTKTSTDNGTLLGVSGSVTITSYDKTNQFVSGNYSFTQSVYLNTLKGSTVIELREGNFRNLYVQKLTN